MGYWFTCEDPEGNIYESEAEMARAHGVIPSTFNSRKRKGLPLKSCLKPYIRPTKKEKKSFVYKGVRYKSLRDCCIKLNIPCSTVYYFIERYEIAPEKAVDKYFDKMKG